MTLYKGDFAYFINKNDSGALGPVSCNVLKKVIGDCYDSFFTASDTEHERPRYMYYYDEVKIIGYGEFIVGQFYIIKTNNGETISGDIKEVSNDIITIKHLESEITIKLEDINSYEKRVPMTSRKIQKYHVNHYPDGIVKAETKKVDNGNELSPNTKLFREKMLEIIDSQSSILVDSRKTTALRDSKTMNDFEKAYEGIKSVVFKCINNNFQNQPVEYQVFILRFFELILGYRKAEGKDIEDAEGIFVKLSSIMSLESLREYKKKYNPYLGKKDTTKDVVKRLGFTQM